MILDDEIIVGLLVNGSVDWYVSIRQFWVMDHVKWLATYRSAGFELHNETANHGDRSGIAILNRESLDQYLQAMVPFRVEAELLSVALQELVLPFSWEDLDYLYPSLLVNFDLESFLCIDREDYPYKKYMANGWTFHYGNFLTHIPDTDRYWVVNGIDYFQDLY
jgi:hypothetical protein